MLGFCDRCNEETNRVINIVQLPELAAVEHLGYRQVCAPCYDDLLEEANEIEERGEDRRAESRATVAIKAHVEGNTAHLKQFSDEIVIEEISPSGLRLRTVRDLEPGALIKVQVPSYDFEASALVEVVWQEAGQSHVGLKLIEPSDTWERLWQDNAPEY